MLVGRSIFTSSRILRSQKPRNLLKPTAHLYIYLKIAKAYFCSSVSSKINVNGVDLSYEQEGSQEQVVLCLPGALGTTQSDFGPQLKGLSNEFTVVAFDPRGYGKSIPPVRDFPSDFFVRDALDGSELMRKLGFKKYSLLGWSDGGITAMILAASNPRAIDKMVIWGSNSFVTNEEMETYEKLRDTDTWHPKMKAPLEG
ncbi:valacyclovir hydrolase-like isoform X2 [Actinia tenebrosa]|uniref:Valacyclovir hydrolase-like isoform X2 n=1 Tax=Actinia tenebrosa TaxID=6105 RepID=A0A6P8I4W7_ACTTE|nr:valacyclovir hydrolase-like isoform X2 [Actinia tenebrosa]